LKRGIYAHKEVGPDGLQPSTQGLCPYNRDIATLFWPVYMLQPQFASITIHKISDIPDAGKIYHQAVFELFLRQVINYLALAVVKALIKPLNQLISIIGNDSEEKGFEPSSTRILCEKKILPRYVFV